MPARPAPADRPLPLARASARLEFDDLLRRRTTALGAGLADGAPGPEVERAAETAQLLDGLAREFADAVDAENVARQQWGAPRPPIEYADAVVVAGTNRVAVEREDYDREPVFYATSAGGDDLTVTFGRDLDGYLRTGEARYEPALGLA